MQKRKARKPIPFAAIIITAIAVICSTIIYATAAPKQHNAGTVKPATPTHSAEPLVLIPCATTENEVVTPVQTEPDIPSLATDADIDLLARTIWAEAGGVDSIAEQAAVAWCVLNRVDARGNSIADTILAPYQFACRRSNTVPECFVWLAEDVVARWEREHAGIADVGRTLPAGYEYFVGDGTHNHFSVEWRGNNYWDWSLPNPYES